MCLDREHTNILCVLELANFPLENLFMQVNHSQRLGDRPLKVWILSKQDGVVQTAHCTCMAGAGEACSHVGACLFAVDTGVRMKKSVTCTQKENIWLPAYVEKVQFKRLKDIDFTSSKGKKRLLDTGPAPASQPKKNEDVPPPSAAELGDFYGAIEKSGIVPAVFSVLPDYCSTFREPVRKQPAHLRNLFCEEAQQDSLDMLIEKADNFMLSFEVSETTAKKVEAATKDQSRSPQWFQHRAGRVTASVMKSVCTTSTDKPSVSLVKKVCYPEKEQLAVPAVMWGVNHEIDAFRAYEAQERRKHIDFACTRSGLHLSSAYPFVGATPDAVVSCACCGKGVVEFKCPFLLKDAKDFNAAKTCLTDSNGAFQLQRGHAYFYQVQTQMAVCQVDYCDFVVWAPSLLHIERIEKDVPFCETMLAAARVFFTKVVLPELFSKYVTRQQQCPQVASTQQNAYCFCGGPETGKMVACDNKACAYTWFHFSCVGLKRAPKAKHWYCPQCKGESKEN